MQYAVPQFTEFEDKLIGPLTLKQFLFLLATGGVILFFYSLLQLSIFFFFFAVPIGLIGLAIAFAKFNGRPMYGYLGAIFNFISRPQARIFMREEPTVFLKKTVTTNDQLPIANPEPAESRLKKLAYLLDQKTQEEEELITRS